MNIQRQSGGAYSLSQHVLKSKLAKRTGGNFRQENVPFQKLESATFAG